MRVSHYLLILATYFIRLIERLVDGLAVQERHIEAIRPSLHRDAHQLTARPHARLPEQPLHNGLDGRFRKIHAIANPTIRKSAEYAP